MRWGRIDEPVCNAAVNPHLGPSLAIGEEACDKVMTTNVKNVLWLCRAVIPQMAERKDGAVIIVSSIAGLKGSPPGYRPDADCRGRHQRRRRAVQL